MDSRHKSKVPKCAKKIHHDILGSILEELWERKVNRDKYIEKEFKKYIHKKVKDEKEKERYEKIINYFDKKGGYPPTKEVLKINENITLNIKDVLAGIFDLYEKNYIIKFSELGDTTGLLTLHELKHNINTISNDNKLPLMEAVLSGKVDSVKFLVDNGADINLTPFHFCASSYSQAISIDGDSKILEFLTEQILEKKSKDEFDMYLSELARWNNFVAMKMLIEGGGDVNSVDEEDFHMNLLHYASRNGNLEAVKYLIDKGATIDANDQNGSTSLYHAISCGNLDIVKLLIKNGIDIYESNSNGNTPLIEAIYKRNIDVIKCLIESSDGYVVNPDDIYEPKDSPLHNAITINSFCIVKILVDNYADMDKCGEGENYDEGQTPLTLALTSNSDDNIIYYIIDNVADLNKEDGYGITPLYASIIHDVNDDIIMYMFKKGAEYEKILRDPEIDEDIKEILDRLILKFADLNFKSL